MTKPVKRGWGQNVRLSPEDVKRNVLKGVKEWAAARGRPVPNDMDFMSKAEVVYLDDNHERVEFTRVVVTWDEEE